MSEIKPGTYGGAKVEDLPGGMARLTVGGKSFMFNANGFEVAEAVPAEKPEPVKPEAAKKPEAERDWKEGLKTRA